MARMNVRQMWKAKLEGRTVPASGPAVVSLQRPPFAGRVLGIDPSLRGTGLALVEFAPGRQPVLLRCQTVRVPAKQPMAVALAEIHRAVTAFVAETGVKHVALEQTIYVQNFQTAQILGAARGVARYVGLKAERDAGITELKAFSKETLGVEKDNFDTVLKTLKSVSEEDVKIFPRWTAVGTLNRIAKVMMDVGHAKGSTPAPAPGGDDSGTTSTSGTAASCVIGTKSLIASKRMSG